MQINTVVNDHGMSGHDINGNNVANKINTAKGCDLLIHYQRVDSKVVLRLPEAYRIQAVDEVIMQLKEAFGVKNIILKY